MWPKSPSSSSLPIQASFTGFLTKCEKLSALFTKCVIQVSALLHFLSTVDEIRAEGEDVLICLYGWKVLTEAGNLLFKAASFPILLHILEAGPMLMDLEIKATA